MEPGIEGVHHAAVGVAVFIDDLHHPVAHGISHFFVPVHGIFLELKIHCHIGQIFYKFHEFNEGGDPAALEFFAFFDAGIQSLDFCQGLFIYFAGTVGGAVHSGVMNNHQFAVFGDAHVDLDLIHADFGSGTECFHGVFGIFFAPSPMGGHVDIFIALGPVIFHGNASL